MGSKILERDTIYIISAYNSNLTHDTWHFTKCFHRIYHYNNPRKQALPAPC